MLSRIFHLTNSSYKSFEVENFHSNGAKYLDRRGCESCKVLISGPRECGKSSLLFSLAVSFAEEGKTVLFICPKKPERLPILAEGQERPRTNILQKIHMVYLDTREKLLKFMASVHLNDDTVFDCLILDDMDFYVTSSGMKNEDLTILAKVLAYTVDAYSFHLDKLKSKMSDASGILAVSVSLQTNSVTKQHLYHRWMDHIFKISIQKDSKLIDKLYQLSVLEPKSMQGNSLIDVKYSISNTCFSVSEIVA